MSNLRRVQNPVGGNTATAAGVSGKPALMVVEVMHNYQAQERHQLTLMQGEKLTVLEKDPSGWWIGRNSRGGVGIFPSTYVHEVATAPPPAEITKEIATTKLATELGLQITKGNLFSPNSSAQEDSSVAFDDDDLFALSDDEIAQELLKATKLRDQALAENSTFLNQLSEMQDAQSLESNVMLSGGNQHQQRLTIVKKRQEDLVKTERKLGEDVEDLVYELQQQGIQVPQFLLGKAGQKSVVIEQGGVGGSITPSATTPRSGPSAGANGFPSSQPAVKKVIKKVVKKIPKPNKGPKKKAGDPNKVRPDWLNGVEDAGACDYLEGLSDQMNGLNADLDTLEATLESLQKEAKTHEEKASQLAGRVQREEQAATQAKEGQAQDKESREAAEIERLTALLASTQEEAKVAKQALKEKIQQHQTTCDALQADCVRLEAEVQKGKDTYLEMQKEVEALAAEQESTGSKGKELQAQADQLNNEAVALQQQADQKRAQLDATIKGQKDAVDAQMQAYRQLERERRVVYNEIQELKGNLRVYCRIKPCLGDEVNEHVKYLDDMNLNIYDETTMRESNYEFDFVLGEKASQEEIFEEVRPLATSVLDGYNVCIFAYGQTGSGKTYTMEGPPDNRGVNFRTVRELFNIAKERGDEYEINLSVAILEVYNNVCFDLQAGREQTKVRWGGDAHGVVIEPMKKHAVESVDDVQRLLEEAYSHRKVAGTSCNAHSSRSHCILSVFVDAINKSSNTAIKGKLHLIDLAGSERVKNSKVDGDRLKEATHINSSLTHLKTVIQALANKNSQHIGYRNSVLTSLLQDSLGGNCKCLMFANVSPLTKNIPETICTMKYAAEARRVEVGKATANVKSM